MSLFDKLATSTLSEAEKQHLMRVAFFTPPESKEDLHSWINLYLDLDFPDSIVDSDSNSSPMDMIWETYNHARLSDDEKFTRVLYYSSRDSYKTLGAAVLETLIMVLLKRNVAHMAAIKDQSMKAQEYVKKFFNRPVLRDYVTRRHEKRVEFTWPNMEKDIMKPDPTAEPNYIQILICTMQGVNFDHVPFMVIDEVDVVDHPEAYEEAKFIPSAHKGKLPITLLTSTRKFAFGLVQKEIDEASTTLIQIRHWNILDVTEACPPSRHWPEKPKITIYRSDDTLKSISEEEYNLLPEEETKKYVKDEGYEGCLKNCTLFSSCQGRLANLQKSTSKLLKPIPYVISKFRESSPEKVKSQMLCRKPSTEGLIYKMMDPKLHMKTYAQIAEMLDGEPRDEKTFKRPDFVSFIRREIAEKRLEPVAGIDWGDTHNFVFVFGVIDGQRRLFVLECLSSPELLLDTAMQLCWQMVSNYCSIHSVLCFADSAYPGHIKTFRKGTVVDFEDGSKERIAYRIKGVKKYSGSVQGGIENCRSLLLNAAGESTVFFVERYDKTEGTGLLFLRLGQYHWIMGPDGKPTSEPSDENDDEPDAFRYLVMEKYGKGRGPMAPVYSKQEKEMLQRQFAQRVENVKDYDNWLNKTIQNKVEEAGGVHKDAKGRSGSIIWDLGDIEGSGEDL